MKRQTQETGVRTYFGEDLISLQSEPLKALDAFFAQYGQCIIQGCEVTGNVDGTYDVAAGLVALDVADRGITVMPFGGAAGVVFPLYMSAQVATIERLYDDGEVKPIAYEYAARVSAQPLPEGTPSLTIAGIDGLRFVDVVQDAGHRFITDAERAKWNGILQLAKEYADAVSATGSEAALRSAKEYTDTRETAILAVVNNKATETLQGSKEYTDTTVAGVIGAAPDLLNTIQEIAAALNNDPNFSTTILQKLAEKLDAANYTAEDVRAKLLTVDGHHSGLVADMVADHFTGGAKRTFYLNESQYAALSDFEKNNTDNVFYIIK